MSLISLNGISHILFFDESGDHDLKTIDPSFPILVLCGVIIKVSDYPTVELLISQHKERFFDNPESVILVSRWIRKQEGPFRILSDRRSRDEYFNDLNATISLAQIKILMMIVDKKAMCERYSEHVSPYELSLMFMIERLVTEMNSSPGRVKRAMIIAESRSSSKHRKLISEVEQGLIAEEHLRKEDRELYSAFSQILTGGTSYISANDLQERVVDLKFCSKLRNVAGLQLADLCAYPGAGYALGRPSPAWNIVQKKLCGYPRYRGNGLKVFPYLSSAQNKAVKKALEKLKRPPTA
jgi:hypothetical protein